MDAFSEKLNNLLVETFRDILKIEEHMLASIGKMNLSINEVHMIEAVGKNKAAPKTISELAEDMSITLPSVTNAIKKLESNGFVRKTKSGEDGRSVLVELTPLGKKIDSAHSYFHRQMVTELAKELSEQEKNVLTHAIEKLDKFFKGKLEA